MVTEISAGLRDVLADGGLKRHENGAGQGWQGLASAVRLCRYGLDLERGSVSSRPLWGEMRDGLE